MSHYTNPKRLWYISKDRLALVKEATSSAVDGVTSSYVSIAEAKTVKIHGIGRAEHFNTGTDADTTDYTSSTAGPLEQIHQQFHEALVFKAIAAGYEDPRNLNLELAQYFNMKYETIVKETKKFARSSYLSTGMIVPQDF